MYADDAGGGVPRADATFWWVVFAPYVGGQRSALDEYRRVRVFTCTSYPIDNRGPQFVCYVVNAFRFASPSDTAGVTDGIMGLSPLSRVQKPVDTVHMADNENGSWRPIFGATSVQGGLNYLNDIWSNTHLPYASPTATALSGMRRVAAARHGVGPNLLYFDGHAGWKNARRITVGDFREQRY
jgi:prepilin-type processing-associated H-X9-DG protein